MGLTAIPHHESCTTISCQVPPFLGLDKAGKPICPSENMIHLPVSDTSRHFLNDVYGCLSDCSLYHEAQACCAGIFQYPCTCMPSNPWFKEVCPGVYSYAYDDLAGHQSCPLSNISLVFSCI